MSLGLVCILMICIININIFSEKHKKRRDTIYKLRKKERMKKRDDILNGKYEKYLDERSKINLNKKLYEENINKLKSNNVIEFKNNSEVLNEEQELINKVEKTEDITLKDIKNDN